MPSKRYIDNNNDQNFKYTLEDTKWRNAILVMQRLKELGLDDPLLETIFAKSQIDELNKKPFWYSENGSTDRDIFSQNELSESELYIVRQKLEKFRKKVAGIAELTENAEEKDFLGNCIRTPDDQQFVKAIKTKNDPVPEYSPLLVYWGHRQFTAENIPKGPLIGRVDRVLGIENQVGDDEDLISTNLAPEGAGVKNLTPAYKNRFPVLMLWLAIFILIAFILFILLSGCGILNFYACDQNKTYGGSDEKIMALESQLKTLELEVARKNLICAKPVVESSQVVIPIEDAPLFKVLDEKNAMMGDLNVSLAWNGQTDLDLSLTCPDGGQISFHKKKFEQNGCGVLDLDANYRSKSETPVEHIFINSPETGKYELKVNYRSRDLSKPLEKSLKFKVQIIGEDINRLLEENIMPTNEFSYSFMIEDNKSAKE